MQVNGTAARLFRVKDVANVLDVHISTVYRLVESEQLGSVRIGFGRGAIRIPAESLSGYLVQLGLNPLRDTSGEAIA